MQKTFLEFFAGIGLMRLGLEKAGWQIAFANDIDSEKFEMYRSHFGDAEEHFVLGDIHKLSARNIPEATLATASFPCNDLSLAGARAGLKGSQSSAYWGFTTLLDQMGSRRPRLVLLENVTGFLSSHGGRDLQAALVELNRLGYAVDALIVDALKFVPQSRQRLFVVGIRDGSSCVGVQEIPGFYESDVRPPALAKFIFDHPEINWRVRNLPKIADRTPHLKSVLENLPIGAAPWWTEDRVRYLLGQMSARHREFADRMIAGRDLTFGTVFRRIRNGRSMAELRTDGIAGCLRTPRGGSGRQILFMAGCGRAYARLLTARECARLMGADEFMLTVPLNQALFGFGDAVCVPVVHWIAETYLNRLIEEMNEESLLVRSSA